MIAVAFAVVVPAALLVGLAIGSAWADELDRRDFSAAADRPSRSPRG